MNGIEIERFETFDFLGVTLDENRTWKPHTDKVATELSKYSGIINKLKKYLPPYTLKSLYNCLVQTHLDYPILVWGFKCNRLVKLPKQLVKIITCGKYNAMHMLTLFSFSVTYTTSLCHLRLPSWRPGLHDSSRHWLGRIFDSPR